MLNFLTETDWLGDMPAKIYIGGDIPSSLTEDFMRVINSESLGSDSFHPQYPLGSEADLLSCRCNCDGEWAPWEEGKGERYLKFADAMKTLHGHRGNFYNLESFLISHKIPFDKAVPNDYRYRVFSYRPELDRAVVWNTNEHGEAIVEVDVIVALHRKVGDILEYYSDCNEGIPFSAQQEIEDAFEKIVNPVYSLPAFRIVG
jgi:hypothetical protein